MGCIGYIGCIGRIGCISCIFLMDYFYMFLNISGILWNMATYITGILHLALLDYWCIVQAYPMRVYLVYFNATLLHSLAFHHSTVTEQWRWYNGRLGNVDNKFQQSIVHCIFGNKFAKRIASKLAQPEAEPEPGADSCSHWASIFCSLPS